MYECRAVCERAGESAAGPVRQSPLLAVTETDALALRGMQSAGLSTSSTAGGSA